jgi:hypothetical protein
MEQTENNDKSPADFKIIFIVDPVRGERIHLAKFIKYEKFTIMAFLSVEDCFKKNQLLSHDILIVALRKDKSEVKHLLTMDAKYRKKPIILLVTPGAEDVNLAQLQEAGFSSVFKAGSTEKVKEIAYGIIAPDGLAPRSITPHPVPL